MPISKKREEVIMAKNVNEIIRRLSPARRKRVEKRAAQSGHNTVLAGLQLMITLWHDPHPLHREILEREQQRAKIASLNFHIV